jgi:hypothetical protein
MPKYTRKIKGGGKQGPKKQTPKKQTPKKQTPKKQTLKKQTLKKQTLKTSPPKQLSIDQDLANLKKELARLEQYHTTLEEALYQLPSKKMKANNEDMQKKRDTSKLQTNINKIEKIRTKIAKLEKNKATTERKEVQAEHNNEAIDKRLVRLHGMCSEQPNDYFFEGILRSEMPNIQSQITRNWSLNDCITLTKVFTTDVPIPKYKQYRFTKTCGNDLTPITCIFTKFRNKLEYKNMSTSEEEQKEPTSEEQKELLAETWCSVDFSKPYTKLNAQWHAIGSKCTNNKSIAIDDTTRDEFKKFIQGIKTDAISRQKYKDLQIVISGRKILTTTAENRISVLQSDFPRLYTCYDQLQKQQEDDYGFFTIFGKISSVMASKEAATSKAPYHGKPFLPHNDLLLPTNGPIRKPQFGLKSWHTIITEALHNRDNKYNQLRRQKEVLEICCGRVDGAHDFNARIAWENIYRLFNGELTHADYETFDALYSQNTGKLKSPEVAKQILKTEIQKFIDICINVGIPPGIIPKLPDQLDFVHRDQAKLLARFGLDATAVAREFRESGLGITITIGDDGEVDIRISPNTAAALIDGCSKTDGIAVDAESTINLYSGDITIKVKKKDHHTLVEPTIHLLIKEGNTIQSISFKIEIAKGITQSQIALWAGLETARSKGDTGLVIQQVTIRTMDGHIYEIDTEHPKIDTHADLYDFIIQYISVRKIPDINYRILFEALLTLGISLKTGGDRAIINLIQDQNDQITHLTTIDSFLQMIVYEEHLIGNTPYQPNVCLFNIVRQGWDVLPGIFNSNDAIYSSEINFIMSCIYCGIGNPFDKSEISYWIFKKIRLSIDLNKTSQYNEYFDNSKLTTCRTDNVSDKLFILMKQKETKQHNLLVKDWKTQIRGLLSECGFSILLQTTQHLNPETEGLFALVSSADPKNNNITDTFKSFLSKKEFGRLRQTSNSNNIIFNENSEMDTTSPKERKNENIHQSSFQSEKLKCLSKHFGEFDCHKLQPQQYSSLFDECFRTFEFNDEDLRLYFLQPTREITFVLDDNNLWVKFKLLPGGGFSHIKYDTSITLKSSEYMDDDEMIDVKVNKTLQAVEDDDQEKFTSKTNGASFMINVESAIKLITQIRNIISRKHTLSRNTQIDISSEIIDGLQQDLFDILNRTELLDGLDVNIIFNNDNLRKLITGEIREENETSGLLKTAKSLLGVIPAIDKIKIGTLVHFIKYTADGASFEKKYLVGNVKVLPTTEAPYYKIRLASGVGDPSPDFYETIFYDDIISKLAYNIYIAGENNGILDTFDCGEVCTNCVGGDGGDGGDMTMSSVAAADDRNNSIVGMRVTYKVGDNVYVGNVRTFDENLKKWIIQREQYGVVAADDSGKAKFDIVSLGDITKVVEELVDDANDRCSSFSPAAAASSVSAAAAPASHFFHVDEHVSYNLNGNTYTGIIQTYNNDKTWSIRRDEVGISTTTVTDRVSQDAITKYTPSNSQCSSVVDNAWVKPPSLSLEKEIITRLGLGGSSSPVYVYFNANGKHKFGRIIRHDNTSKQFIIHSDTCNDDDDGMCMIIEYSVSINDIIKLSDADGRGIGFIKNKTKCKPRKKIKKKLTRRIKKNVLKKQQKQQQKQSRKKYKTKKLKQQQKQSRKKYKAKKQRQSRQSRQRQSKQRQRQRQTKKNHY